MTQQDTWDAVDTYFEELFTPPDTTLAEALEAVADAGLPPMSISPNQGKLLHVLALAHGARSILEIGTLGGYSTIWLARALPPGGRLITLEIDPTHVSIAQSNLERAGVAEMVEIRLGLANTTLSQMVDSGAEPFDLVFIDADKTSTADYLTWSLRLTRPGSLIIIDNVVRKGEVANLASHDKNVQGVRRALKMLASDSHFIGAGVQTVGSKGYDGFSIALVAGG